MAEDQQKEKLEDKTLTVKRIYPPDLRTYFVQNAVAQHQPDCFILSFFEVWPPLVLGETEEERLREVASLESIDATCVARFVLTPSRMREIVGVLSDNLKKYDAQIGGQD